MSTLPRFLASAVLALAVTTPALAQQAPGKPQRKPDVPTTAMSADTLFDRQKEGHVISTEVIGMNVVSRDGKKLGKIDSLILDNQHNVVGAVVSVGGFLAMGSKKVGIRWENIQTQHGDEPKAVIDLSEQQLADAPEFKTLEDMRKEREDQDRKAQQRQNIQRTPGGVGAPPTGTAPTR